MEDREFRAYLVSLIQNTDITVDECVDEIMWYFKIAKEKEHELADELAAALHDVLTIWQKDGETVLETVEEVLNKWKKSRVEED